MQPRTIESVSYSIAIGLVSLKHRSLLLAYSYLQNFSALHSALGLLPFIILASVYLVITPSIIICVLFSLSPPPVLLFFLFPLFFFGFTGLTKFVAVNLHHLEINFPVPAMVPIITEIFDVVLSTCLLARRA